VYSPVTAQTYLVECTPSASGVLTCINNADSSAQIAFSRAALQDYTQADANSYAATHNLGQ
jgi:hypothetical protein